LELWNALRRPKPDRDGDDEVQDDRADQHGARIIVRFHRRKKTQESQREGGGHEKTGEDAVAPRLLGGDALERGAQRRGAVL
jgi:hypothetical protein